MKRKHCTEKHQRRKLARFPLFFLVDGTKEPYLVQGNVQKFPSFKLQNWCLPWTKSGSLFFPSFFSLLYITKNPWLFSPHEWTPLLRQIYPDLGKGGLVGPEKKCCIFFALYFLQPSYTLLFYSPPPYARMAREQWKSSSCKASMWAFSFIMLAKSKHETPMRSWPYIHKAVIYFFIGLFIRGGKILCCKNIFTHSRKEGFPQLLLYFVSGKSGVVSLLRHFSPGKWNPTRKKGHGIRAKEIEAVARPKRKKPDAFSALLLFLHRRRRRVLKGGKGKERGRERKEGERVGG